MRATAALSSRREERVATGESIQCELEQAEGQASSLSRRADEAHEAPELQSLRLAKLCRDLEQKREELVQAQQFLRGFDSLPQFVLHQVGAPWLLQLAIDRSRGPVADAAQLLLCRLCGQRDNLLVVIRCLSSMCLRARQADDQAYLGVVTVLHALSHTAGVLRLVQSSGRSMHLALQPLIAAVALESGTGNGPVLQLEPRLAATIRRQLTERRIALLHAHGHELLAQEMQVSELGHQRWLRRRSRELWAMWRHVTTHGF